MPSVYGDLAGSSGATSSAPSTSSQPAPAAQSAPLQSFSQIKVKFLFTQPYIHAELQTAHVCLVTSKYEMLGQTLHAVISMPVTACVAAERLYRPVMLEAGQECEEHH